MITVGFVLGEGRGLDVFFDVLDYVIDVYGYIIGMGLFFDNRWVFYSVLGGGVCKSFVLISMFLLGICTLIVVFGLAV